jgi:hypothetical protein
MRRAIPSRAQSPLTPDDERWTAADASSNGTASNAGGISASRLLAVAYILAVSMPPIGFCLGIVIAVRVSDVRSRHGLWIIVISILAATVWVLIIISGALSSTGTSDY